MDIQNILKILIGVIIFCILVYLIKLENIIYILSNTNFIFVIASTILTLFLIMVIPFRWKIFLPNVSYISILNLLLISNALGIISPARVGSFSKIILAEKFGVTTKTNATMLTLLGQFSDLLGLILISFFGIVSYYTKVNIGFLFVLLFISYVITYASLSKLVFFILNFSKLRFLDKFKDIVKDKKFSNEEILKYSIIMVILWMITISQFWALLKSLNVNMDLIEVIFLMCGELFGLFALPAGIGSSELGAVLAGNIINLSPEISISLSILYRFTFQLPIVFIALLMILLEEGKK